MKFVDDDDDDIFRHSSKPPIFRIGDCFVFELVILNLFIL